MGDRIGGEMMFRDLLDLPDRPQLLSPGIMAYIGDSIYEVFIRSYLIEKGIRKNNELHKTAIKYVNAEAQASLLKEIKSSLTEEEEIIVRRGRNSSSGQVPKNTDVVDYRHSTAFEALIGYLYLEGEEERLQEILTEIKAKIEEL
ncbi:MAG: ribonuclease III family protein [Candidatus Frackibacter sp. T328-2]|nr:MAG: ribonuclease III family protein [Candidatus Frackibacter sp. T328-2]